MSKTHSHGCQWQHTLLLHVATAFGARWSGGKSRVAQCVGNFVHGRGMVAGGRAGLPVATTVMYI